MPDVCGVVKSSSSECTILTPCFAQSIGKPRVEQCIFVAVTHYRPTSVERGTPPCWGKLHAYGRRFPRIQSLVAIACSSQLWHSQCIGLTTGTAFLPESSAVHTVVSKVNFPNSLSVREICRIVV